MDDINSERFPIGIYTPPDHISGEQIELWIHDIEQFHNRLTQLVSNLSPSDLETVYREGGWTIAQVVHHCADSHMNSWIRFRLALTEENPTIRPYFEALWAELPDSKSVDMEDTLMLIKYLHIKWARMLRNISQEEMRRTIEHPEYKQQISIDSYIGNYAWHCNHHLAHIQLALNKIK